MSCTQQIAPVEIPESCLPYDVECFFIDGVPVPMPRDLQFADASEYVITRDLFRTHVNIVTPQATVSQPLRTLIDTGFSGGILISTRVADSLKLKMCPINMPV